MDTLRGASKSPLKFEFRPKIGEVGLPSPTERALAVNEEDGLELSMEFSAPDAEALAKLEADLGAYLYEAGRDEKSREELTKLFGSVMEHGQTSRELEAELSHLREALEYGKVDEQLACVFLKGGSLAFIALGLFLLCGPPGPAISHSFPPFILACISTGLGLCGWVGTSASESPRGLPKDSSDLRVLAGFLSTLTFLRNVIRLTRAESTKDTFAKKISSVESKLQEANAKVREAGARVIDELKRRIGSSEDPVPGT